MNKSQLKLIADRRKAKERKKARDKEFEAKREREFARVRDRLAKAKEVNTTTPEAIEAFNNQPLTPTLKQCAEMEITDDQLEEAIVAFQKRVRNKYAYSPKKLTVKAYQEGFLTNGQFSVLMNMPSSYIIRSDKLRKVHCSAYYKVAKFVGTITRT